VRGLLAALPGDANTWTIVDMEAGLEHLSRSEGTLRFVDHLLVVVEPYAKAIETARRTIPIAAELGIPRTSVVANKVRDDEERRTVERFCKEMGSELLAVVPYDDAVRDADRDGRAPIDHTPHSPLIQAVGDLVRTLDRG
jgi:CO dehydrogenase maturation factor